MANAILALKSHGISKQVDLVKLEIKRV